MLQSEVNNRITEKKKASHRKRIVSLLSVVVAFFTIYALILPAVTMEKENICGLEEHTHSAQCYETRLVCGLEEGAGAHVHTAECFDAEDNLICTLEESAGHIHTEDCYEEVLVCGLEEHTHTEECFAVTQEDADGSETEDSASEESSIPETPEDPSAEEVLLADDGMSAEEAEQEISPEEQAPEAEPEETAAEAAKDENIKPEAEEEKDSAESEETAAVIYEAETAAMKVRVEAPSDALPEGTVLYAEDVTDENTLAKIENTITGTAVQKVQAVDITFKNAEGEKVEPVKEVRVILSAREIRQAAADETVEPVIVHMDDAGRTGIVEQTAPEKLDAEPEKDELVFDTGSFSIYAVVYTVDFTYDGYEFSMQGGSNIFLSNLFTALAIQADASEAVLAEFSNPSLIRISQTENNWLLTSLAPFTTQETLTVTMENGVKYVIRVTDDNVTDNLRDTLATATITIDGVEDTDNSWEVKANQPYTIHLEFQEVPQGPQFAAETGTLVYKLPDSFNVTDTTGGSIEFTYDTGTGLMTITGCTYRYDPESKCIIVTLTDEAKEKIGESGNAKFRIDITGVFSSDASRVEFSDTVIKDVTIDDEHDLDISKTGYYDPSDDKVHYTLTVSSSGVSTNVSISDVISGSALTMDPGSVHVSGNSGTAATTYQPNGFLTTIDRMLDGETVTVTYTASVNHAALAGKTADQITASDTGNTATVRGDDDPPESVSHVVVDNFDSVTIEKGAGNATVNGNITTIPWAITYNANQAESVGGTTITDHITGDMADKTSYSGSGITVTVYDGDTVVQTIERTWGQLGVSGSEKSWTYTLPADGGNKYKYVISYTTDTDVTGQLHNVSVGNTVEDDEGHTDTGSGTGIPGDDGVTLTKTHGTVTPDTITWYVDFGVPVSGLTSAVVTDTLPYVENYKDTIDPSNISVSGLLEGESYTIDTSNPAKVVITFYQDTAKTIPGLKPSENKRNIVVTLTTDNDPEWVAQYGSGEFWQATHTNNVQLNANGEPFTAQDSAKPASTGIQKSGESAGTVTINGVDYPVFKYTIDFFGLSDDTQFPITLTDTFDTSVLKYYKTDGIFIDWYGGTYGERCTDGSNLNFTDTNTGFTVTINKTDVQPYTDWPLSKPRRLIYYLIVKDENALNTLLNQSMSAEDFAVPLANTASDGSSDSSATVDYQYPGVDKELLGVDENSGVATYRIMLNPNKLTLNDGNTITMTDSYENLSVDFASVRVTLEDRNGTVYGPYNTSSDQDRVSWNYRGNTGTFYIPDETKVTITYSARVTKEGAVTISNTASMMQFSETVTEDTYINSSGGGSLDINYIWLFKHEGGDMTKPITGVEFTLVDANGNPVIYPATAQNGKAGQPITFTTETRTTDDGEVLSGYARIYLSEQEDGISFQKGVTYYLLETKPADGYQRVTTRYGFTIADHPDYNKYEYHIGDVLRVNNWPQEGVIEIRKTINGAENLTDAQKAQITFTLSGTPSDGTEFETRTFTYAEFTSGEYIFEQLAPGTYTVTETGYEIGRYEYAGTTASATNGEVVSGSENRQAAFTITQADIDANRKFEVGFENHYIEPNATSLTVKKTDTSGELHLYNATFQILKKAGDTYLPLEEAEGTQTGAFGADSTFTIDYENRDSGVKITGLSDGDYKLIEITAPEGYVKTDAEITFTVQNGVFTYTNTETNSWTKIVRDETNNTFTLEVTVKNEPEHTYTITKVAQGNLDAFLSGAVFTIYEYNTNGTSTVVTTMTTDETGQILIDDRTSKDAGGNYLFSAGHAYYVQETTAPVGYVLPENPPKYFFYFETLPAGIGAATLASMSANNTVLNLANGPQQLVMENVPETTQVTVSKDWLRVDGNNAPSPEDITEIQYRIVQIASTMNADGSFTEESRSYYPDENTVYTVSRKTNQGDWDIWTGEPVTGLPTGKSDGTEPLYYTYAVEEIALEGYLATYGDDKNQRSSEGLVGTDNKVTIYNSPEPVSITVNKMWADGLNSHDKVKVALRYRNSTTDNQWVGEFELDASNNWTHTWNNLDPGPKDDPKYYYIEEYTPAGYEASYSVNVGEGIHEGEITVTNRKIIKDVAVYKQWLDENGNIPDGSEQDSVTVELYRQKGIPSGHAVNINIYNTNGNLDSSEIKYVADGGSLTITTDSWAAADCSCTITSGSATLTEVNGYTYQISNVTEDITLYFNRGWGTVRYSDYVEPSPILEDTKEPYGDPVTLSAENNWYNLWQNLPEDTGDGKIWYYTVEELPVMGYTTSYENNDGVREGTITVTNRKIPPVDFSFTKQWKNSQGGIAAWPAQIETITATLKRRLSDGTEDTDFSKTFALSNSDEGGTVYGITWSRAYNALTESYTFTFAPLDGEYTYYIEETPPEGYLVSYSDANHNTTGNPYALDGQYMINTPEAGYELPKTGGIGTDKIRWLSVMLLSAAAAGWFRLHRRRSRAAPQKRGGGSRR